MAKEGLDQGRSSRLASIPRQTQSFHRGDQLPMLEIVIYSCIHSTNIYVKARDMMLDAYTTTDSKKPAVHWGDSPQTITK